MVLSAPVVAWWLKDLITTADHLRDPDYFVRPLQIDPTMKVVIGGMAVALAVGAILELTVIEPAGPLVRRRWTVMCPLMAAGIICGA